MSDANWRANAALGTGAGAVDGDASMEQDGVPDARHREAWNRGGPVANGGVSPARRDISMRNLLNDGPDDIVAGSDQDGGRDAQPFPLNGQPRSPPVAAGAPTLFSRVGRYTSDSSAAEMLLAITHASPRVAAISRGHAVMGEPAPAAALTSSSPSSSAAVGGGFTAADPDAKKEEASTVPATTDKETGKQDASAVGGEVAETTSTGRPARRSRRAPRPTPKAQLTNAAATAAATAAAAAKQPTTADAPVGDGDVTLAMSETATTAAELPPPAQPTPPTRSRDKRRATLPPPPRTTPTKKSKTVSTRPQRVATTASGNESDYAHAELVIANHSKKATQASPSFALATGHIPVPAKTKKRKAMSQRQYDELLAEEREAGSSSHRVVAPSERKAVGDSEPGVALHACEFCRVAHSAHATFKCHTCLRVYHDKCFVEAFKSEIQDDEPIEQQMERLSLHRPDGRAAVLRCLSCQAALVDFCTHRGVHWHCQCPSCTTVPEKIAAYRQVSLKMIIDEHNDAFALMRGKKGSSNGKKSPAAAAPAAVSKAKSKTPPPTTATANGSRARGSSRRARGAEAAVNETAPSQNEEPLAAAAVEPMELELKAATTTKRKPPKSPARNRRGRAPLKYVNLVQSDEEPNGTPTDDTAAMDVDDEGDADAAAGSAMTETNPALLTNNGYGSVNSVALPKSEADDLDDDVELSLETLERLVSITKEDDGKWSFRVACSLSEKSTESGSYKEATLYWHPSKAVVLRCACCPKVDRSVQSFVQHTDTKLLLSPEPEADVRNDIYKFMFVLQKSGKMVPYEQTINLVRQKYTNEPGVRRASDAKAGSTAPRPSGAKKSKTGEPSAARLQALELLSGVQFTKRTAEPAPVGRQRVVALPVHYACEVVCAEVEKWLKPLTVNPKLMRNKIADSPVITDEFKSGTFDLSAKARTPKTCKIVCQCCKLTFTQTTFIHHTAQPLVLEQQREADRRKEEERQRREEERRWRAQQHDQGEDDEWNDGKLDARKAESPAGNAAVSSGTKVRVFTCVAGVITRDPLTVLRLEVVLDALGQLGTQKEINKAIADIVKHQEASSTASV